MSIVCLMNVDIDCNVSYAYYRAQLLFEGRLALNPGLNLTRDSFSFVQKHFLGQFSLIFIEHRIINLLTKRIKLNLLLIISFHIWFKFCTNPGLSKPSFEQPGTEPEYLYHRGCWWLVHHEPRSWRRKLFAQQSADWSDLFNATFQASTVVVFTVFPYQLL